MVVGDGWEFSLLGWLGGGGGAGVESFEAGGEAEAGGDGLLIGDGAGVGGVGVEGWGGHAGHDGVLDAGALGAAFLFDDFGATFGDALEEGGGVHVGAADGAAFFEPGKGVGDGDGLASAGPEGGHGFEAGGALEDVGVGVGGAVEEAVPKGVQDVGIHVARAFAFEAEDHDAIAATVARGEFDGVKELGAVAGLVGVANEVEEPHQFDGAIREGKGGVRDLGFDFGKGLHGIQLGVGFEEFRGPGDDGIDVVLFEGEAGGFGGEDGEVGVVTVWAVELFFDGLGVGVAGVVTDEVGPDGGLTEVPALSGFLGGVGGEFDFDLFQEELFVGGVSLEEAHDPGALVWGEVVVGDVGDDFVPAVPPSMGGGEATDGKEEAKKEGQKSARHEKKESERGNEGGATRHEESISSQASDEVASTKKQLIGQVRRFLSGIPSAPKSWRGSCVLSCSGARRQIQLRGVSGVFSA
jgi:hypothetical protein